MTHDDHGKNLGRKAGDSPKSHKPSPANAPRKRLQIKDIIPTHTGGITQGTRVLTADGDMPVEYLEPGDRIITRAGIRVLRGIDTPAPKMFKLAFDCAQVVYADGVQFDSDTGAPFAATV
jgi:hypothetical protein